MEDFVKRHIFVCFMAGLFAAGAATITQTASSTPMQSSADTNSKEKARLQAHAKITMAQAREIALKKVPGEVKEGELEKEHGKIVYSFDIQRPGDKDITEVQVSAIDGSIVSVEKESAASEAKESKHNAAKGKKPNSQDAQKPQP